MPAYKFLGLISSSLNPRPPTPNPYSAMSLAGAVQRRFDAPVSLHDAPSLKINTKRHAVYFEFPPVYSLTIEDASDVGSTWDYVHTSSHTASSSCCTSACSGSVSAAEELVARYRAGEKGLGLLDTPCATPVTPVQPFHPGSECALDNVSDYPPSTPLADVEVRARFRESRMDAVNDARGEALSEMRKHGVGERDVISCPCAGCHERLSSVKALTFHLHIHNIHQRAHQCRQCEGHYESARELSMHHCRRRRVLSIGDSIRRAISISLCQGARLLED